MRGERIVSILALVVSTATVGEVRAQNRPDGGSADAGSVGAGVVDGGASAGPAAFRPAAGGADPRFATLPELTFRAINTRETVRARLYRADGTVDPQVVDRLSRLLRDVPTGENSPVVVRTIQLLVKIATHFDAREIEVVSAYRTGRTASGRRVRREGYHGVGSAIDFRIPTVEPALVAAFARTFAHVGVGLYPRLGFVHLDSREQSFFWVNRAGRSHHGSDRALVRDGVADRERAWSAEADLPWDPAGVTITLDTHLRTIPGARHSRHHRRRRHHRSHRRRHLPLHVFGGARSDAAAR